MSRENPASTRDHILDATAAVIRNLGLGRTTTKEIAQAAGLSEAALYRYFADKTDLFLCVLSERLPQLVAALENLVARAGQRTVRVNLEEIARVALPFYAQTLPLGASLFSEPELLARHQSELRSRNAGPQRGIELLAQYIRAEQKFGRLDQRIDPEAAAALLLGTCLARALMRRFIGEPDSADDDERFAKGIVRTLLLGLAPEDRP